VAEITADFGDEYRRLIESLPLVVYVDAVDDTGSALYVSPQIESLLGYSVEEWLEQSDLFMRLLHPEDRARVVEHIHRVRKTRERFVCDYRLVARDGRVVWFHDESVYDLDEAGNPVCARGYMLDITEQKRVESEREQALALVDSIVANMPGLLWVKDAVDFRYVRVSGSYERYFGFTNDEVRGRDDYELFPDLADAFRAGDVDACATGLIKVDRQETRRADGSAGVIRVLKVPIVGAEGVPLYVIGHAEDITEQVRAEDERRAIEEKFNQMADCIDEVFWIVSADRRRVEYVSPAFDEIWGFPRERVLADVSAYHDSIHPDDVAAVGKAWHSLDHALDIEYRIVRPDGDLRWVRHRTFDIRDGTGERQHFFGIVSDITDRRHARDERERAEGELRMAQKLEAVGQLAAGIAHELNTPLQFVGDSVRFLGECFDDLTGLIAEYRAVCAAAEAAGVAAELVEAVSERETDVDLEYVEERVPAALKRTIEGIERASTIVKAMKAYAHPDRPEQSAEDLNEALRNTLIVASNEYKYVADVDADYGDIPFVTCHLGELSQVFLNLVVNAAHAIEESNGEGERGMILIRTRSEHDVVVVEIEDTGCGIPDDARSRVFEPFFTTKEVGRGTGQGLALARTMVCDRHGGSLTFDSTVGVGTTFRIRLPVHGIAAPERKAA
jgi:PAS domain S-box-containing protein